ncbi:MAG TPA: hypothetical protein PLV92_17895, partial [Pirellulaceae bacterium]|nr:hypothetical protein [Pirellulaceae bacterium]
TAFVYRITFINARALENIPDFSTNSTGLTGARALPSRLQHGRAPGAETQRVTLTTDARNANFTLSLTHGGTTFTTEALSIETTQAEVQSAIDAAFAGLTGATLTVEFWTGRQLDVTFGGSLLGVDVEPLSATLTPEFEPAVLTSIAVGSTVVDPEVPAHTLVADFAAQPLTIPTGGDPVALDMDGQRGEITELSGHLAVAVGDYIDASGNFLVTFASRVTGDLTDERLTIAGTNLNAFVGADAASPGAVGLQLTNGVFGMVAYQTIDATQATQADPKYAFVASGAASLVGVDGLALSGQIRAGYNRTGAPVDASIPSMNDPIEIEFVDAVERLRATGEATLSVDGFVDVSGLFSLEMTTTTVGTVTTTEWAGGAADVSIFLGIGSGAGGASTFSDSQPIGVRVDGASVGFLFERASDSANPVTQSSGYAIVGEGDVSLVGVEGLTLTGHMSARVNATGHAIDRTVLVPDPDGGPVVEVNIDFTDGANVPTFIGDDLTLSVGGLIEMTGDLRVEKKTVGATTHVLIGAENVSAFLGVGGIGVALNDGVIGAVLTSGPDGGGYAVKGRGDVSIVGVDVPLVGSVAIEVNRTGSAIDESVSQRTKPSTPVKFDNGTTVSRIVPPTDFDIALSSSTFITGLFQDLADYLDQLQSQFEADVDSDGTVHPHSV